MNIGQFSAWIGISTLVGATARVLVQGKQIQGYWGDMIVGVIGVFAVGFLLQILKIDLTEFILTARPSIGQYFANLVNVFIVGFTGALVVRILLKFAKT